MRLLSVTSLQETKRPLLRESREKHDRSLSAIAALVKNRCA
jgi:hypothetical protein